MFAPLSRACALALLTAGPALSQTEPASDAPGHITLELNTAEQVDGACRLSFVIHNSHDTDIAHAVFEAVMFTTAGGVDRLTLFDFGTLPAARVRVRQFMVPGLDCALLGQLLINGAGTCAGEGVSPDFCTKGLVLRSRMAIEVVG